MLAALMQSIIDNTDDSFFTGLYAHRKQFTNSRNYSGGILSRVTVLSAVLVHNVSDPTLQSRRLMLDLHTLLCLCSLMTYILCMHLSRDMQTLVTMAATPPLW